MSAVRVWEDMVAINSAADFEFSVLPPIGDQPAPEKSFIKPETIHVDHPIEHYVALDRFPIPLTEDRAGYHGPRHWDYWLSGLRDYGNITAMLREYDVDLGRYFELGSSTGRTLRHFLAYEREVEVWACDLNRRSVAWMLRYLPQVLAFQSTSIPALPLEDRSVDFVCAFSVFTHIESFEHFWLAELRRILRPGGIAYLSSHTEHSVTHMTEKWPIHKALSKHPDFRRERLIPELEQKGRIVFRFHGDRSYSSHVIYSTEYLHDSWGRFLEIVEIRRQFPQFQDAVVMRRR